MIKAILFDLDDTLYNYEPVHQKSLSEVYKVFNEKVQKISKERFKRLFNLAKLEIKQELSGTASSHNRILYFQRLIEKTHNTVDPEIILNLYNTYWNSFLKNMKLKSDVIFTLRKLKKDGFKIVIVSDLTTNIQLRKIHKVKITSYIDYLVTSEEAGSEKPHPIMFLLSLKKLNMLSSEVIFVGDSRSKDVSGANAVGMETVLISNKVEKHRQDIEDYSKPHFYIRNISEVLNIIEDLNKK